MTRMKRYFDSSVKPVSFADGEKVLVYNPKKKKGHFAKWSVSWVGPMTVQRKLNESNYVIRGGKGKCVVIHVDRMRKLPISSLDENESSVDMPTDLYTHVSEDKETSVLPSKRRRLQPATDVSTSRTADTENCSGGGECISPVDETDNNDYSVYAADTTLDAPTVSSNADTGREAVQAGCGTGNAPDPATGHGLRAASRLRRSHRKPARFLEKVTASSSPIGRFVGCCSIVSCVGCRLVSARTPGQPAVQARTCADVSDAVVVSAVHMSKKRCAMSDVEPSSSEVGVLLKRLNVGPRKQRHMIAHGTLVSDAKDLGEILTGQPQRS